MRARVRRSIGFGLAVVAGVLAAAPGANAEILVFLNGRTLAVRAYSVDGDVITATLRNGGAATFERRIVARIDPETIVDEAPQAPAPPDATALLDDAAEAAAPGIPPPFAALIHEVAARHDVDPRLVHAVVQAESNYQPRARSAKGARGLMQVLPSTAAALGVGNLYEPSSNLDAGVRYLKSLLAQFDLPVALAAYNAGPAAVRRYGGVPPFVETQRYVARVLGLLKGSGHESRVRDGL